MLPLLSAAAYGCDLALPYVFPVFPPADGAPTNAAVISAGELGFVLTDALGAEVELVREPLAGYLATWTPTVELAPFAAYTVEDGATSWTFTTGGEPLTDPPIVPEVDVVDLRDPLLTRCGTPPRTATVDGDADGVLLTIDRAGSGDDLREDTEYRRTGDLPMDLGLSSDVDVLRFGVVDAAGNWSGWSEPVDLGGGCGCAGVGPGGWTGLVLPLAWRRRRAG